MTRVHGRPVLQRALRVVAIGVVVGGVAIGRAHAAQERGDDGAIATIEGTIVLRGCVPIPSEIDLRAEPIRVGRLDARSAVDPRATDLIARIARTVEPRTLAFTITGVQPSKPYHLSIAQLASGNCGRIFWRGPAAGLVVSGGPRVEIEGFAATTEVEVLDQATDEWVGVDRFSPADPSALRHFRWRSSLRNIVSGELQVSTLRFPNERKFGACDEPQEGIVYRQSVPAGDGAWAEATVSFGAVFGRGITPPDGIAASVVGGSVTPVDARTRLLVRLGAPVYVRVVPFTGDGPECDIEESGVPGWVIMSNIPGEVADPPEPPSAPPILEAGNGHLYRPPYVDDGRPTYGEGAYKVLEDHQLPPSLSVQNCGYDPIGCIFLASGLGKASEWVFKDTWYVYKYGTGGGSGGGGLGDVLGSFVTGLGGALSVGVNAAANVWNDAIAGAKTLILDALITVPGIGQFCNTDEWRDKCKTAISTGVTIALASMGVPPSLPNWDQLKYEGSDYLAALAAEEIEAETGIPAELTEGQLKDLGHMAVDQMTAGRNGGNPAYTWVTEYLGFEPASVTIEIVKNGLDPLPPDMVLRTTGGNLYVQQLVPLPRRFPLPPAGSSTSRLRIPVVQAPRLTGIAPPYCFSDRYGNTTCTPNPFPNAKPLCVYEHFVGYPKGFEVIPLFGNCQYVNVDDIYYRDAWTARFLQTNCLTLTGFTLHVQQNLVNIFNVELEALPGLTMGTGAVVFPPASFLWSGPFGAAACGLK